MKNKFLIIVLGEPNSISSEIIFKSWSSFKKKNYIQPILIANKNNLTAQMKYLNFKYKLVNFNEKNYKLKYKSSEIPIIDIHLQQKKTFKKISKKSNLFINESFNTALRLIKKKKFIGIINGPIKKETFLNKEYNGITEFISKKLSKSNDEVMLIYNKILSVCPITTHIPLRKVSNEITVNKIVNKILIIDKFYRNKFNKKIKFAILGLNPHCNSNLKFSEEEKIIKPAINYIIKKKINVDGPFSADSFFVKENIDKYDVVIGMYHDQVLTPVKTLFGFNSINITLGIPIIRISPDHGVGEKITGKNVANPASLIEAFNFFKTIKC